MQKPVERFLLQRHLGINVKEWLVVNNSCLQSREIVQGLRAAQDQGVWVNVV